MRHTSCYDARILHFAIILWLDLCYRFPEHCTSLTQLPAIKHWSPQCRPVNATSTKRTSFCTNNHQFTGYEGLTAVVMKSSIFWDITRCSPFQVNRRFGGTYHLHLQGRKNKLSKKPTWKQVASRAWRWRPYVPPKHRLTLNGLHGVICQKMALFITTSLTFNDDRGNYIFIFDI
jgi:hypothetical protein